MNHAERVRQSAPELVAALKGLLDWHYEHLGQGAAGRFSNSKPHAAAHLLLDRLDEQPHDPPHGPDDPLSAYYEHD